MAEAESLRFGSIFFRPALNDPTKSHTCSGNAPVTTAHVQSGVQAGSAPGQPDGSRSGRKNILSHPDRKDRPQSDRAGFRKKSALRFGGVWDIETKARNGFLGGG